MHDCTLPDANAGQYSRHHADESKFLNDDRSFEYVLLIVGRHVRHADKLAWIFRPFDNTSRAVNMCVGHDSDEIMYLHSTAAGDVYAGTEVDEIANSDVSVLTMAS